MAERCRFEPLLSAWVDGELRPDERAALGQHLSSCARCRADIDSLRTTKALLASIPVRQPVLPVVTGPAADRRPGGDRSLRRVAARTGTGVGAVAAAVVAAALALGGSPQGTTPVPVEVYVAQHLVRSVGGPVSTPAIVETP